MDKSSLAVHGGPKSPQGSFHRHARAVGVLWGVFSLCFCIILVVVFIQPHWIGSPRDGQPAHMGLWRWCFSSGSNGSPDSSGEVTCSGNLLDINTFTTGLLGQNSVLLTSTILTALAVVVTVLSVFMMLLFCCVKASTVFHILGWIQILAGCLLGAAVCIYPLSFNSPEVVRMCGPTARQYNVGECNIRWAYVLAIIGVFDAIVLASLALVLATRNVKPSHSHPPPHPHHVESIYSPPELYKDYGDGASLAASRKSLNLQPVMMMSPHTMQEDPYGGSRIMPNPHHHQGQQPIHYQL